MLHKCVQGKYPSQFQETPLSQSRKPKLYQYALRIFKWHNLKFLLIRNRMWSFYCGLIKGLIKFRKDEVGGINVSCAYPLRDSLDRFKALRF